MQVYTVIRLDETKLRNMMNAGITKTKINEFGYFDDLKNTVDKRKVRSSYYTK